MSNRRVGFVAMLVAIDAGLFVQPLVAQQPAGIVAYDWCHSLGRLWAPLRRVSCRRRWIQLHPRRGDGIGRPVWSAGRIGLAFIDSEPSLYVLNLADWSIARVPGLNALNIPPCLRMETLSPSSA